MKANIIELMTVFDELLTPPTDKEQGIYWFRSARKDNLTITLIFSTYEDYTSLIIYNEQNITIVTLNMKNCSEIRVLDEKKKLFEIIHDESTSRCFISLDGENILTYNETED